jgi:hypothetical protein
LPDDLILERYLVWERPEGARFNPATVKQFIARFRDTLNYSGALASNINEANERESIADNQLNPLPDARSDKPRRTRQITSNTIEDVLGLKEGAVVLQWPEKMSAKSLALVKRWLDLMAFKIESAADDEDDDDKSDDLSDSASR